MAEKRIVQSVARDVDDFFRLFVMSGPKFVPALYGGVHERVAREMFCKGNNLTSHEHTAFAKVDDKNTGMVCAYDWRQNKKEQNNTTLLLIKSMRLKFLKQGRHLQWAGEVLGRMDEGSYYIASMAVYQEMRSRGLGMDMLRHSETMARDGGCTSIALDAETYNKNAINLYRKFGMDFVGEPKSTVINGEKFEFVRMVKRL